MADSNAVSVKRIIRSVLIGTLIGGVLCIAFLALMAVIMTGVDIPKPVITPLALACGCLGAFSGGLSGALVAGRHGWLVGALCGLVLFLLILIAGISSFEELNGALSALKLALLLVGGTLGGMLGVNLRKHR